MEWRISRLLPSPVSSAAFPSSWRYTPQRLLRWSYVVWTANGAIKASVESRFLQTLLAVSLVSNYFPTDFLRIWFILSPRIKSKMICWTTLKTTGWTTTRAFSYAHCKKPCSESSISVWIFVENNCSVVQDLCGNHWFNFGVAWDDILDLWFAFCHARSFRLLLFRVYPVIFIITTLSVQKLAPYTCILVVFIDLCVRCTGLCLVHFYIFVQCRFWVIK